jgi:hypothetical protein
MNHQRIAYALTLLLQVRFQFQFMDTAQLQPRLVQARLVLTRPDNN